LLAINNVDKTRVFYIEARRTWKPMHRQPLFAGAAYYPHSENFSVSDYLFNQGICLPSSSNLSSHDIDRVIDCLNDIFNCRSQKMEALHSMQV
jgi:dTDP-4-amino-4,6-dideoxygalactose transaminase